MAERSTGLMDAYCTVCGIYLAVGVPRRVAARQMVAHNREWAGLHEDSDELETWLL